VNLLITAACAAALTCVLPAYAQTAIAVSSEAECAQFKALVSFNYSPATKLPPNAEISAAPTSGIIGKCFVLPGRAGSNSGICSASDWLIAGNGTSSQDKVSEFKTKAMALAEKCLGRKADHNNNGGATWTYGSASVFVGYGYGDPKIAGATGNRIQFNNAAPGFSR
jgi:hypothetical protein